MKYTKDIHKPTSEELEDIFDDNGFQKKIQEAVQYSIDAFDNLVVEQLVPYGITRDNFPENKDRLSMAFSTADNGDTFHTFYLDYERIFIIRMYNISYFDASIPNVTTYIDVCYSKEDVDNVG